MSQQKGYIVPLFPSISSQLPIWALDRCKNKMPKLKTKLVEGVEPLEGQAYTITSTEEIKTPVQGYSGYRVALEPLKRKTDDDNKYATVLWARDSAGVMSKLGSFIKGFIDAYGDEDVASDTDSWTGATVLFKKWRLKDREIEVVKTAQQA